MSAPDPIVRGPALRASQHSEAPLDDGASPESVARWGDEGRLSGIWTPARPGVAQPMAVLFFNAGVIPRIGPHRLNVKLARALADRGFPCARFDLGGTGDSRRARDAADFRQQAVNDLRAVIDGIESEHGISQVLVFGLCSGAAHAQAAALHDPRVRGLFLLDGYSYPTRQMRRRFVSRMIRAYGLSGFVARLWRFMRQRRGPGGPQPLPPGGNLSPDADDGALGAGLAHPRAAFARDMATLVAQGTDVTLVFSGSVLQHYAYEEQLADGFPGADWLSTVHCRLETDLDHTLITQAAQRRLREVVVAWAERVAALPPRASH